MVSSDEDVAIVETSMPAQVSMQGDGTMTQPLPYRNLQSMGSSLGDEASEACPALSEGEADEDSGEVDVMAWCAANPQWAEEARKVRSEMERLAFCLWGVRLHQASVEETLLDEKGLAEMPAFPDLQEIPDESEDGAAALANAQIPSQAASPLQPAPDQTAVIPIPGTPVDVEEPQEAPTTPKQEAPKAVEAPTQVPIHEAPEAHEEAPKATAAPRQVPLHEAPEADEEAPEATQAPTQVSLHEAPEAPEEAPKAMKAPRQVPIHEAPEAPEEAPEAEAMKAPMQVPLHEAPYKSHDDDLPS